MNDDEHSVKDQKKDKHPFGPGTEPRLPWEVHPKGAQPVERGAEPRSDAKVFHFAEAGKIDVLSKINRLRREMEKAFRDRDTQKRRVAELEKECAELRTQVTSSKERSETFLENEAKWEADRRKCMSRIDELQNRLSVTESERDDLAAQIEVAKATMSEITSALDWRDNCSSGAPPESNQD